MSQKNKTAITKSNQIKSCKHLCPEHGPASVLSPFWPRRSSCLLHWSPLPLKQAACPRGSQKLPLLPWWKVCNKIICAPSFSDASSTSSCSAEHSHPLVYQKVQQPLYCVGPCCPFATLPSPRPLVCHTPIQIPNYLSKKIFKGIFEHKDSLAVDSDNWSLTGR